MRKIILAFFGFTLTLGSFAQGNGSRGKHILEQPETTAQIVYFGVKAGMTAANLSKLGGTMKLSLYAGGFAEYPLSHTISLQPEIIYSRQGSYNSKNLTIYGLAEGEKTRMWVRTNYINVPVMVKVRFSRNWSLEVGPQAGFMLNARARIQSDGRSFTIGIEDAVRQLQKSITINTLDFAIALGLNYRLYDKVELNARFNTSLSPAFRYEGEKMRNRVAQLGISYFF